MQGSAQRAALFLTEAPVVTFPSGTTCLERGEGVLSVLLFLHESRPQAQSDPRQPWACTERQAPGPSAAASAVAASQAGCEVAPELSADTPSALLPGGCPWHPPSQQIEKLSSPPLLRLSTRLGPGVLESGKVFHCQGLVSAGPWLARCRQAVDGVPALTPGQPDRCLSVPCGHCLLRARSRPLTRVCVCVCVQVREHTSHLEAELEKHMVAASAECQNYAKEVAGVSLPSGVSSRSACLLHPWLSLT